MRVLPPREVTDGFNKTEDGIPEGKYFFAPEKDSLSEENYYETQSTDIENSECTLTDLKSCIDFRVENLDDGCKEEGVKDFTEEPKINDAFRIGSTKVFKDTCIRDEDFIDIQASKSKDIEPFKFVRSNKHDERERLTDKEVDEIKGLLQTKDDEEWIRNYQYYQMAHRNKHFHTFEVNVPSARVFQYLIDTESFVHTSYQRRIPFTVPISRSECLIEYSHHRLQIKTEESKFKELESKGNVRNLLEGKPIAYINHYLRNFNDLENSTLYDYDMGVFLVLYPEMFSAHGWDIEGIRQRTDGIDELLHKDYYSFSSLNCECVVTYILKGDGYSRQLDEMGWKMWLLCDILDHLCYYKWNLFVLFCTFLPPLRPIITQVMLLLHFCFDEYENRCLHLKQEKYYKRQSFKYIGTFVLRIPLLLMGYGFVTLVLSHIGLPIVLGLMFNVIHLRNASMANSGVIKQISTEVKTGKETYTSTL